MKNKDNLTTGWDGTHPPPEEWMAFLYQEMSPARTREMETHLIHCGPCAAQLNIWKRTYEQLDQWKAPVVDDHAAHSKWMMPALAACALFLLLCSFMAGRMTLRKEVTTMKTQMNHLAETLNDRVAAQEKLTVTAIAAGSMDTQNLLKEYARLSADQHNRATQANQDLIQGLEKRVGALQLELRTLAVNTDNAFRQTKFNLVRLASDHTQQ